MTVGPALGDERGARRPRAAHPESEQKPEERELPDGLRQAARRREQRIHQDARDDAGPAAAAIGERAEEDTAERRRRQRERAERAAHGLRDAEVGDDRRQHHRIHHDVEAVEHPAERGRDERALRCRRGGAKPPERRRLGRRHDVGHEESWRPRVSGPNQTNAAEHESATAMGIDIAVASGMPLSRRDPMRIGMIDPMAAAA